MVNSAKRAQRRKLAQKAQRREGSRSAHQMDPVDLSRSVTDEDEEEDQEILFVPGRREKRNHPGSNYSPGFFQLWDLEHGQDSEWAIASVSQDTARIRQAYDQLHADNITRDKALSEGVWITTGAYTTTSRHPDRCTGDEDGNLRAAYIGITCNETFLHGVRVVGPGPPRPSGIGPAMSTPYQPTRDHDMENTSTSAQLPTPSTPLTVPYAEIQLRCPPQEIRQGYRPAAPIQRFNNKSLNWPVWFRHFRVVADFHGWSKDQRALQLVSYLDETAMNVAQELGDNYLYNYDVLVKLLSYRFDPASRV